MLPMNGDHAEDVGSLGGNEKIPAVETLATQFPHSGVGVHVALHHQRLLHQDLQRQMKYTEDVKRVMKYTEVPLRNRGTN